MNILNYTTTTGNFSLKYKYELIESLKLLPTPIDVSYQFDPGREGGFGYILKLENIALDKKSKTKILLTDKLNTPLYINGELARDLTQIGNFKSALYIVQ